MDPVYQICFPVNDIAKDQSDQRLLVGAIGNGSSGTIAIYTIRAVDEKRKKFQIITTS
jgi:hypothetical protein